MNRDGTLEALSRTLLLLNVDLFGNEAAPEAIATGLRETVVRLETDKKNLSSPAGQTALVTLFGLVAMMGMSIDLRIPEMDLLSRQPPLQGHKLRNGLLDYGNDLIPNARLGLKLSEEPSVTFVLGDASTTARGPIVRVSGTAWDCRIGESQAIPWIGDWPFGALAAAGSAASLALRAALPTVAARANLTLPVDGYRYGLDEEFTIDLSVPGAGQRPVDLGAVDIVSGGAITNAALFALLRVPELRASFRVIEPDVLDLSNLNRYELARRSNIPDPKADLLASMGDRDISIKAMRSRFEEGWTDLFGSIAPRVIAGVDDIPSRWEIQRANPGWLCIGATSHNFAMISRHVPGFPCAGCAHPRNDDFHGPIPTVSFVSSWVGLLVARSLLVVGMGVDMPTDAEYMWPFTPEGKHSLHPVSLSPRSGCPIACSASAQLRSQDL